MKHFVILLMLLSILTGCNSVKNETPLEGSWNINGKDVVVTFSNSKYNIDAGCNVIAGEYEIQEAAGTISFSQPISTQMGCPDDIAKVEQELPKIFTAFKKYEIAEEMISLIADDMSMKLEKSKETSLIGTNWKLSRILTENGLVNHISFSDSSLILSEDGKLSGLAICNSMMGNYEASDNSIKVEKIATTKKLCDSQEANSYEQTLITDLEKVTNFTISRDTLTLENDEGTVKLVYMAE